jgi:hypothetical protein
LIDSRRTLQQRTIDSLCVFLICQFPFAIVFETVAACFFLANMNSASGFINATKSNELAVNDQIRTGYAILNLG